jgi:cytochrome c
LDELARRRRKCLYVAGVLANTPDNLIQCIRNPPDVDPRTAMPNLGIGEPDARDIAAYLYTLK